MGVFYRLLTGIIAAFSLFFPRSVWSCHYEDKESLREKTGKTPWASQSCPPLSIKGRVVSRRSSRWSYTPILKGMMSFWKSVAHDHRLQFEAKRLWGYKQTHDQSNRRFDSVLTEKLFFRWYVRKSTKRFNTLVILNRMELENYKSFQVGSRHSLPGFALQVSRDIYKAFLASTSMQGYPRGLLVRFH